jgi:hypothetical protein
MFLYLLLLIIDVLRGAKEGPGFGANDRPASGSRMSNQLGRSNGIDAEFQRRYESDLGPIEEVIIDPKDNLVKKSVSGAGASWVKAGSKPEISASTPRTKPNRKVKIETESGDSTIIAHDASASASESAAASSADNSISLALNNITSAVVASESTKDGAKQRVRFAEPDEDSSKITQKATADLAAQNKKKINSKPKDKK